MTEVKVSPPPTNCHYIWGLFPFFEKRIIDATTQALNCLLKKSHLPVSADGTETTIVFQNSQQNIHLREACCCVQVSGCSLKKAIAKEKELQKDEPKGE